jgi:predicted HAD superfamily Cof-like phosphohydrolase
MNYYKDVTDFHKKFRYCINSKPTIPDNTERALRVALIKEEIQEHIEALKNNDVVEIADSIADILYVVIGTAIAYGIDLDKVWHEVHKTNMNKVCTDTTKKAVKPNGWISPNIKKVLDL